MKKKLRKQFKSTRTASVLVDQKVCMNLEKLVSEHSNLGLYMALPGEIRLDQLIDKLFLLKNLYFPYVYKGKKLEYRRFFGWDQLQKDEANINSPLKTKILDPKYLDCVIMPSLAISLSGYRLGYGGGYYDKTFENYQGIKIGVTYDESLVIEDFHEEFDVRLDYIVTEKRIIKIEKM